jgi:hypothetical protein
VWRTAVGIADLIGPSAREAVWIQQTQSRGIDPASSELDAT